MVINKKDLSEDDRVYFIKPLYDYEETMTFLNIGAEAKAKKIVHDGSMYSGWSILVELGNSRKEIWVDASMLVTRKEWVDIYNKIATMISGRALLQ